MILLTCAVGPAHTAQQQIAEAHHRKYFPAVDHRHMNGFPADYPRSRHPNWLKTYWLNTLLQDISIGEQILYLDTDVLFRRRIDLEKVIPEGKDFAAARNCKDYFQCGVMFIRCTERTRHVFKTAWATGPLENRETQENLPINMYLTGTQNHELDARYNFYPMVKGGIQGVTDPFIIAWHGAGTCAARHMRNWLGKPPMPAV